MFSCVAVKEKLVITFTFKKCLSSCKIPFSQDEMSPSYVSSLLFLGLQHFMLIKCAIKFTPWLT